MSSLSTQSLRWAALCGQCHGPTMANHPNLCHCPFPHTEIRCSARFCVAMFALCPVEWQRRCMTGTTIISVAFLFFLLCRFVSLVESSRRNFPKIHTINSTLRFSGTVALVNGLNKIVFSLHLPCFGLRRPFDVFRLAE